MPEKARAILDELRACEDSQYVSPQSLAWIHVGLGENEYALDRLAQAVAEGTPYMFNIHQVALYDPLRSDPRFAELASQVGSGVVASSHDSPHDG